MLLLDRSVGAGRREGDVRIRRWAFESVYYRGSIGLSVTLQIDRHSCLSTSKSISNEITCQRPYLFKSESKGRKRPESCISQLDKDRETWRTAGGRRGIGALSPG